MWNNFFEQFSRTILWNFLLFNSLAKLFETILWNNYLEQFFCKILYLILWQNPLKQYVLWNNTVEQFSVKFSGTILWNNYLEQFFVLKKTFGIILCNSYFEYFSNSIEHLLEKKNVKHFCRKSSLTNFGYENVSTLILQIPHTKCNFDNKVRVYRCGWS